MHRWLLRHSHHGEDVGHLEGHLDLLSLAKHYKIPVQDLHHALADAFLTAQIWQKLIYALEKQGVRKLGQLRRIAG